MIGAVEIRFADARRPEDPTHVRFETFDGPIALLLALIPPPRVYVRRPRRAVGF